MSKLIVNLPLISLLWLSPLALSAAPPAIATEPAVRIEPLPKLNDALSDLRERSAQIIPAPVRAVMIQANEALRAAMPEPGISVGQPAPDFTLPNAFGDAVNLSAALADGPVVLSFYRGAWCPYCNLELRALKQALPQFEAHAAQLIAVTPQTPDRSRDQIEKGGYRFEILSDLDDKVMAAYGLLFELPDEINAIYQNLLGLDLADYNGAGRYRLPIPATFVIDQSGIVRAAFVEVDYTRRMEPAEIVAALSQITVTTRR